MRLKILVVPFSILIALVLVIGYIKPDTTVLQEKRVLLESKNTQLGNLSEILKHIDSLSLAIEAESDTEQFVLEYVPKDMDQERVIDMFNYLAGQSGVFAYVMNMREVQVKSAPEETMQVVAGTPVLDGGTSPLATPSIKPKLRAYTAEVEVRGEYANIRDFLNRLAHMNRFHKISSFSLATIKNTGAEEDQSLGVLTGKFKAEFSYFPVQKVESALNVPVFNNGEFNQVQLEAIRTWANTLVAPLENPQAGRANPFE